MELTSNAYVIVPRGWQRVIEKDIVIYVSPDQSCLRNREEVVRYLNSPITCKCGLKCPFSFDEHFSFDLKVLSLPDSRPFAGYSDCSLIPSLYIDNRHKKPNNNVPVARKANVAPQPKCKPTTLPYPAKGKLSKPPLVPPAPQSATIVSASSSSRMKDVPRLKQMTIPLNSISKKGFRISPKSVEHKQQQQQQQQPQISLAGSNKVGGEVSYPVLDLKVLMKHINMFSKSGTLSTPTCTSFANAGRQNSSGLREASPSTSAVASICSTTTPSLCTAPVGSICSTMSPSLCSSSTVPVGSIRLTMTASLCSPSTAAVANTSSTISSSLCSLSAAPVGSVCLTITPSLCSPSTTAVGSISSTMTPSLCSSSTTVVSSICSTTAPSLCSPSTATMGSISSTMTPSLCSPSSTAVSSICSTATPSPLTAPISGLHVCSTMSPSLCSPSTATVDSVCLTVTPSLPSTTAVGSICSTVTQSLCSPSTTPITSLHVSMSPSICSPSTATVDSVCLTVTPSLCSLSSTAVASICSMATPSLCSPSTTAVGSICSAMAQSLCLPATAAVAGISSTMTPLLCSPSTTTAHVGSICSTLSPSLCCNSKASYTEAIVSGSRVDEISDGSSLVTKLTTSSTSSIDAITEEEPPLQPQVIGVINPIVQSDGNPPLSTGTGVSVSVTQASPLTVVGPQPNFVPTDESQVESQADTITSAQTIVHSVQATQSTSATHSHTAHIISSSLTIPYSASVTQSPPLNQSPTIIKSPSLSQSPPVVQSPNLIQSESCDRFQAFIQSSNVVQSPPLIHSSSIQSPPLVQSPAVIQSQTLIRSPPLIYSPTVNQSPPLSQFQPLILSPTVVQSPTVIPSQPLAQSPTKSTVPPFTVNQPSCQSLDPNLNAPEAQHSIAESHSTASSDSREVFSLTETQESNLHCEAASPPEMHGNGNSSNNNTFSGEAIPDVHNLIYSVAKEQYNDTLVHVSQGISNQCTSVTCSDSSSIQCSSDQLVFRKRRSSYGTECNQNRRVKLDSCSSTSKDLMCEHSNSDYNSQEQKGLDSSNVQEELSPDIVLESDRKLSPCDLNTVECEIPKDGNTFHASSEHATMDMFHTLSHTSCEHTAMGTFQTSSHSSIEHAATSTSSHTSSEQATMDTSSHTSSEHATMDTSSHTSNEHAAMNTFHAFSHTSIERAAMDTSSHTSSEHTTMDTFNTSSHTSSEHTAMDTSIHTSNEQATIDASSEYATSTMDTCSHTSSKHTPSGVEIKDSCISEVHSKDDSTSDTVKFNRDTYPKFLLPFSSDKPLTDCSSPTSSEFTLSPDVGTVDPLGSGEGSRLPKEGNVAAGSRGGSHKRVKAFIPAMPLESDSLNVHDDKDSLMVRIPYSLLPNNQVLACYSPENFQVGDVVWAKAAGLCGWPGKIILHTDWTKSKLGVPPDRHVWVKWYQSMSVSSVEIEGLKPLRLGFDPSKKTFTKLQLKKKLDKAVKEAHDDLMERQRKHLQLN